MIPKSFIENVIFSTVRIELKDYLGVTTGIGTGFFVKKDLKKSPENSLFFLVSNKHVLNGNGGFAINFHRNNSSINEPMLGYTVDFSLKDYSNIYFSHKDPGVDIACVNISTLIAGLDKQIFYRCLDERIFANFTEEDLDAGNHISFIGYPINFFDKAHNLPIIRSGIIASYPKVDFEGKKQFVVDAQVFPGSSGSPVFMNLKEAQFTKGKIILDKKMPYLLLGIISETIMRNNVITSIQAQRPQTSEEVIGLGLVYKSLAISELLNTAVDDFESKNE